MVILCERAGQNTSLFQESIIPVDLFEDDPRRSPIAKPGEDAYNHDQRPLVRHQDSNIDHAASIIVGKKLHQPA